MSCKDEQLPGTLLCVVSKRSAAGASLRGSLCSRRTPERAGLKCCRRGTRTCRKRRIFVKFSNKRHHPMSARVFWATYVAGLLLTIVACLFVWLG